MAEAVHWDGKECGYNTKVGMAQQLLNREENNTGVLE